MPVHSSFLPAYLPSFFLFFFFVRQHLVVYPKLLESPASASEALRTTEIYTFNWMFPLNVRWIILLDPKSIPPPHILKSRVCRIRKQTS